MAKRPAAQIAPAIAAPEHDRSTNGATRPPTAGAARCRARSVASAPRRRRSGASAGRRRALSDQAGPGRAGHGHAPTSSPTGTTSSARWCCTARPGEARVARSADGAARRTIAGRATFAVDALGALRIHGRRLDRSLRDAGGGTCQEGRTRDRTSRASCSKAASSFARPRARRAGTRPRARRSRGRAGRRRWRSPPPDERVAVALPTELWRLRWRRHRIGSTRHPATTACSA